MATATIYEIIGYIASLLVAISLMMSSVLRLRIINLIGAVFFTVYGLLIGAYPVAAMNFFVVVIDLYYLYQMFSAREFFRLLPSRTDSEYLQAFLNFYRKDIQKFLPGFTYTPAENELVLFVLRNLVPAGLVIGEIRDGDSLYVLLDYAIPGYRDLKIGRFVYEQNAAFLRERKIRKIYTKPGAPAHARYLEQMGFVPETSPDGERLYCLSLY
jgi:hypothetical protein